MRLHATVSKDGHKHRTCLHPSRRIALAKRATAMLLRMRPEFFLIARDDLALVAMHGRAGDRATGLAPQQDRGPPRPDRRTPAAPPGGSGDAHGADTGKRLAQAAV